jgi:hypothetical protein
MIRPEGGAVDLWNEPSADADGVEPILSTGATGYRRQRTGWFSSGELRCPECGK